MSLKAPSINCPKCGQPVGDDAVFCSHCGCKLSEQILDSSTDVQSSTVSVEPTDNITPADDELSAKTNVATEDGATPIAHMELPANPSSIENSLQFANTDSIAATKPKKLHKKRNIIIIVVFLLAIAIVGLVESNNAKEVEYYNNMLEAVQTMYEGGADAETAGNLIIIVWQNAIWKNTDSDTDPYTQPNGHFVDDFNDALDNLFDDTDFQEDISKIRDNQSKVITLMQKLKNPPTKYQEAYSVLQTCYEDYSKLLQMATNPIGSLNSFSDDFHEADTATANSLSKMVIYFDDNSSN